LHAHRARNGAERRIGERQPRLPVQIVDDPVVELGIRGHLVGVHAQPDDAPEPVRQM
jgi:hypothetical protein